MSASTDASPSTRPPLTPREHQVLSQILTGRPNKIIADVLGISQRTVEVHRSRIFQKLGVRNAIQLAANVYRHSVATAPPRVAEPTPTWHEATPASVPAESEAQDIPEY